MYNTLQGVTIQRHVTTTYQLNLNVDHQQRRLPQPHQHTPATSATDTTTTITTTTTAHDDEGECSDERREGSRGSSMSRAPPGVLFFIY